MERRTFTYDGQNSADYGLYIAGDSVYDAPTRDMDMITIPGRNGQLSIDQGRFENITVTYPAFIWADTQAEFRQKLRAIRNWLTSKHSYYKLSDNYNPESYRLGIYKSGLEVEPVFYNRAGRFELSFDCKPQRFLLSGDEQTVIGENPYILVNPTPFESLPVFEVEGSGTLTVNNSSMTIANNGTTVIDSEMMEAYEEENGAIVSRNDLVSGEFPTLKEGNNSIDTVGLTSVKVKPRWWEV